MIKIKICGITHLKEVEYLNILQPDYVGFVFAKSKRKVNAYEASELIKYLNKKIKRVGVFRNNGLDEILEIQDKLNLDVIQLHGSENKSFIKSLKKNLNNTIEIWKSVSIDEIENTYLEIKDMKDIYINNIIIDGNIPGSGQVFELRENIRKIDFGFFLAGGITPENVLNRILEAQPYGIDVSSGVETINENGNRIKSFEKMKKLIENIRNNNV